MKFSWRKGPEATTPEYVAASAPHAKMTPCLGLPFTFTGKARAMNLATGTLEYRATTQASATAAQPVARPGIRNDSLRDAIRPSAGTIPVSVPAIAQTAVKENPATKSESSCETARGRVCIVGLADRVKIGN